MLRVVPTQCLFINLIKIIMALSSSFFGLRRGSTKTLTFQVLDGKQVTKDRVYSVRNPRTERQRIQRVLMNTVVRAYSKMKGIVDHSFEGVSYGAKSQQWFASNNLKMLRTELASKGSQFALAKAFAPAGTSILGANAYIISKGSLPSVPCTIGEKFSFKAGTTYADVISVIGAKAGDQLTICVIVAGVKPMDCDFHYARIILQPQTVSGENLPLTTQFINENGTIAYPNTKNEGTEQMKFTLDESGMCSVTALSLNPYAGAVILSRYENGSWLRSDAQMVCKDERRGYSMLEAITLSKEDFVITDEMYLNAAGDEGNAISPSIATIMANGSFLASGATFNEEQEVVIVGSALSNETVKLYCNGVLFTPVSATPSEMRYFLATNGQYRITIEGTEFSTFKIEGVVPQVSVSKVKIAGVEVPAGARKDNVSRSAQLAVEVEGQNLTGLAVTASSGFTASDVVVTATKVTFTAKAPNTYGANGTFSLGQRVLFSLVVESDPSTDPGGWT